jgi:hypothetical protein
MMHQILGMAAGYKCIIQNIIPTRMHIQLHSIADPKNLLAFASSKAAETTQPVKKVVSPPSINKKLHCRIQIMNDRLIHTSSKQNKTNIPSISSDWDTKFC